MLEATKSIIDNIGINENVALGGGTGLAVYWEHRFSTDIDIFIYGEDSYKNLDMLQPKFWTNNTKVLFNKLNFKNNYKLHPIYTELEISQNEKIQFLTSKAITKEKPFLEKSIWGIDFNLETIDEIIAKKIFYRCEKNNARDIFDIAIAIHKNPLLPKVLYEAKKNFKDKFIILQNGLEKLISSDILHKNYKKEILQMNPKNEYMSFAENSPKYLKSLFEQINMSIFLNSLENSICIEIEKEVYNNEINFTLNITKKPLNPIYQKVKQNSHIIKTDFQPKNKYKIFKNKDIER